MAREVNATASVTVTVTRNAMVFLDGGEDDEAVREAIVEFIETEAASEFGSEAFVEVDESTIAVTLDIEDPT